MRSLTDRELVTVWERGRGRPAWLRALLPLEVVVGLPVDELAGWPLGRRDGWLLALRSWMLGPILEATCRCPEPSCHQALEVPVRIPDLLDAWPGDTAPMFAEIAAGDWRLVLRAPTSRDFAGADRDGLSPARLIQNCVLEAHRDAAADFAAGESCEDDLPPDVLAAAELAIAGLDPLSEIEIGLVCPACGASWNEPLNVVEYVWSEIANAARVLLREIHTMASVYGWSEDSILNLGRDRRRIYRDLIAGG
jgi:hypothetical protein